LCWFKTLYEKGLLEWQVLLENIDLTILPNQFTIFEVARCPRMPTRDALCFNFFRKDFLIQIAL